MNIYSRLFSEPVQNLLQQKMPVVWQQQSALTKILVNCSKPWAEAIRSYVKAQLMKKCLILFHALKSHQKISNCILFQLGPGGAAWTGKPVAGMDNGNYW